MKNENPHSGTLQSKAGNKKSSGTLQESFIDMIIHESLLKNRKEKLLTEIDDALDKKDQSLFMKLSSEMNQLNQQFG